MKNKEQDYIKKLYKKTTIYVVRCDNKNNLLDSTPCINCLGTLLELNIKRIVFSHKDNTFMSCNPKDLTINHVSSGANYLKKLSSFNKNNNANNNDNANNNNANNNNANNDKKTALASISKH